MESNVAQLTLLSSSEVWDKVDPLSPDLQADPAVMGLEALPYQELRGAGFERLCYELLVTEGYSPRFFGRSGQKDYGVDIVVEAGTRRTVYQCKNLVKTPAWTEIRDAITKFEAEWLGEASLPSVDGFVYCCPQPLDDSSFAEEWTRFKDGFQRRTGVEISFLDRHGLDARLRRLPDVVAGLFSGSYAEHFCRRAEWLDDPWIRLQRGEARHASIARFLDRHQRDAIHVPKGLEERFLDLLSSSPVVAIRGLPGSGKTLTGLELASRLRDPIRRIYYATLGNSTDFERLWQSVRRRSSLPAVFVLDDCHFDLERTGLVLERLTPELSGAKGLIKLLLILRDVIGSVGQLDDTPDWLLQLSQEERVIESETGLERTRAVTLHLRPELAGLSRQRLERLHYASGGDLLLLDEALGSVSSPQDLDVMRSDFLYGSFRSRYFGGNRRLPTVQTLACLAQFDLAPRASFLDMGWLPGEKDLVSPLMTELFVPPRYQFLHSSLAELALRALMNLEYSVCHLEGAVAKTTTAALIAYIRHLAVSNSGGIDNDSLFMAGLQAVLRSRLKLTDALAEARIKAAVLADETLRSAVEANLGRCDFALLHTCVLNLSLANHPAMGRYTELIERRFSMLFQIGQPDTMGILTIGTGFLTLARNAPSSLAAVEKEHGAERFLRLIAANGTLSELFRILQYATPGFRMALLDKIDHGYTRELVDKTITSRRSIGTLNLTMRELGSADSELLDRLQAAIGTESLLRLIAANGTLFELFHILRYATPGFRLALLDKIDHGYAGELVDKTITSKRSIGTLHLAMRELGSADSELLDRLQAAIGPESLLRLIAANGTLLELFRILQYATPGFRMALLNQIDHGYAGHLVDKTITAGRSIGTLSLTMRELGSADSELLDRLQAAIGAESLLRLIAANGTLFELFRTLEHATPGFRMALLDKIDHRYGGDLVDKTITSGRSIGTLHLTMRELGSADSELLGRLQAAIGAESLLRLIGANGTLFELFRILQYATPGFRMALLDRLEDGFIKALVDKTAATNRSTESFHFALRRPEQKTPLENLVGTDGWWRLIVAGGSLYSLSQITEAMSDSFRSSFLEAASDLTDVGWCRIIARGLFMNACNFVTEDLAAYPAASRTAFREALRQTAASLAANTTWFDLNPSRLPADLDSPEGRILLEALRPRIERFQVEELVGLDFREAANGFAFGWRERPDLRAVLGERLREIVPEPTVWPKEEGGIAILRILLSIARSEEVSLPDAIWLLESVAYFLDYEVCAETHTLPLFLLLWNMAALHFERRAKQGFAGALPDALIEILSHILRNRVQPKGPNPEKLAQLALGGLLGFLDPRLGRQLRRALAPLTTSAQWLRPLALEQTFVPALFALEGLALLEPGHAVFTPFVCFGLLAKSEEYEDVGPAIKQLRERVKRYGKRR